MSIQSDYASHLLGLKRAEIMLGLATQGYTLTTDEPIDGHSADLVARKNGRTVVYEFKIAETLGPDADELRRIRAHAAEKGFDFRLVIVKPPKAPVIEVVGLESILFEVITNPIPQELDSLATAVFVEGVSDIDIVDIEVRKGGIEVAGEGTVDVRLEYGGGEARDGVTSDDNYPFAFRIVLDHNLEVTSVLELNVDTSSFYE